jgi:hypothetical protein
MYVRTPGSSGMLLYVAWQRTTGVPNTNSAIVHACRFQEYILIMVLPSNEHLSDISTVQTFEVYEV